MNENKTFDNAINKAKVKPFIGKKGATNRPVLSLITAKKLKLNSKVNRRKISNQACIMHKIFTLSCGDYLYKNNTIY